MSNLLDTALQYANPAFMAAFAEPLTLTLPDSTTRAVTGIVDRFGPNEFHVTLRNSATDGYSAEEAQRTGRATLTLKQYAGGTTPVTLPVFVPTPEQMQGHPWSDAGMCIYYVGNPPK